MTLVRTLLLLASGACLLGAPVLAADTTSTTDTSTAPRKAHRGPPPELEAYHKLVLAIYDADKDGVLDETERAVLHEDIASGEMEPPPLSPHGRGHRGPPPEILAKYDTDQDGKLNDTERAALEADIASGKLPPPPVPHGPGRAPGSESTGTKS